MPMFEIALSATDEDDLSSGHKRRKEGDITSIRPYPRNCGRRTIENRLIVIIECPGTQAELKERLIAPLWEDGLVEHVDFRNFQKTDNVDWDIYPKTEYVWDIKGNKPMRRPAKIAKFRYKIPLSALGNGIDLEKVRNKNYIYQPFKSASQLVSKFDGKKGNFYLEEKDVDCVAQEIQGNQEVVFQWNSPLDHLIVDKLTDSYVGP